MAETQRDIAEYQTDHDLLVVLNERVGSLTKAVEKKNDDHEGRLRTSEGAIESIQSSSRVWRYILGFLLPVIITATGWMFVQFNSLESTLDKRISNAITAQLTNYQLIGHKQ